MLPGAICAPPPLTLSAPLCQQTRWPSEKRRGGSRGGCWEAGSDPDQSPHPGSWDGVILHLGGIQQAHALSWVLGSQP